ncbi:ABC transporter permease [Paraburkholderia sp. LEh10]|uniref:ABC transporter permease n=1 Tax=Paraburkholderia sp. LEh10 TaxID=2821353 RepID=UPI001AE90DEC|nr:ABC transporter permease [Paraburkholderia sp. LEh10]MBP0593786.1 ABC transporter permease [Paraburkholderia sp. LEh10]
MSVELIQGDGRARRAPLNLSRYLLAGFTVIVMLFLLAPIVSVVIVSFSESSFIMFPIERFSFDWYTRMIEYKPFMDSLLVSIEVALGSSLMAALLGIPAAMVIARSTHPVASLVADLLLAPISVPAIMLGLSLLYFLSSISLGISMGALLIAHTVVSIPYMVRTVLAVYRSISPNLEEASAILGATRLQTLRHTILPLIRPGIFAGGLFAFLISLDNLPLSFFFGTASTNTLPVVMLSYMQNQFDPSIAAISTVQMLMAVVILGVVETTYGIKRLTVA